VATYSDIADELRRQIEDGQLPDGTKLATEEELVSQHRASRNTIRDALRILANEGLVESRPGRTGGTFVRRRLLLDAYAWRDDQPMSSNSEADLFFRIVREQGHTPTQDFSVRLEQLPARHAALLGVEPRSAVTVRRCVRHVDGARHSVQDSWYPQWLCERVPALMSPENILQGTTRLLAEHGFIQVAAFGETIARMPTPDEAELLDLPRAGGVPILHNVLTGYTKDGPLRISEAYFAGDRVRLVSAHGDIELIERHRP
jgi:GntR family transcriptional regulator